ncbi:MAG: hypothetical protein J0I88_04285, partial [Chryseobacterium sp.]|nr:hypothetical protein [Chryseobacterium sp.]
VIMPVVEFNFVVHFHMVEQQSSSIPIEIQIITDFIHNNTTKLDRFFKIFSPNCSVLDNKYLCTTIFNLCLIVN